MGRVAGWLALARQGQTLRQLCSSPQVHTQGPENSSDNSQPSVAAGWNFWVFGDANACRLKPAVLGLKGMDQAVPFWTHAKAMVREVADVADEVDQSVEVNIPALVYANDFVVLAGSLQEL